MRQQDNQPEWVSGVPAIAIMLTLLWGGWQLWNSPEEIIIEATQPSFVGPSVCMVTVTSGHSFCSCERVKQDGKIRTVCRVSTQIALPDQKGAYMMGHELVFQDEP